MILFGLSRIISVGAYYLWGIIVKIVANVSAAVDFPDKVCPTSITPCLTWIIAQSCSTFNPHKLTSNFFYFPIDYNYFKNNSFPPLGSFNPGNKSPVIF